MQQVTLHNEYSIPATAYILTWEMTTGGRVHSPMLTADALASSVESIRPNGTVTLRMGLPQEATSIRVAAVIYADGATAGESSFVKVLLRERQLDLNELEELILFLLQARSGGFVDRNSLITHAQERQRYYSKVGTSLKVNGGGFFGELKINLQRRANEPAETVVDSELTKLRQYQAQLLNSKPKLVESN
jgi:hypothetical protein